MNNGTTDSQSLDAVSPIPVPTASGEAPAGVGYSASSLFKVTPAPGQQVLTVGQGKEFSTIAAAVAAAKDGAVVEVDAGTYTNDFVDHIYTNITIVGVGGMVHLVADGNIPNGKAAVVSDANVEIDNFEFSGATVADRNGAGIRYEGGNLVLRNDYFHDNENGVMGNSPTPGEGSITVLNSTFDHNGNGAGNTHNIYVGDVGTFTAMSSVFTGAVVGHEIKSRAWNNLIEGNYIADGATGTASYSIDLPNGGASVIKGNYIEKGPKSQNDSTVHFGGEPEPLNPNSSLVIEGNVVVNDLGGQAAFLLNHSANNGVPITATVQGNVFTGFTTAQLANALANVTNNTTSSGAALGDETLGLPGTPNTSGAVVAAGFDFSDDSAAHSAALTRSGSYVVGGGGLATIEDQASHNVIMGGTGGLDFTGDLGADTVVTKAGARDTVDVSAGWAGNLITSYGDDLIKLGSGNENVIAMGNSTIVGGTGNSHFTLGGNAVFSGRTNGSDNVSVYAGANAALTETGSYLFAVLNAAHTSLDYSNSGEHDVATFDDGLAMVTVHGGYGGMVVETGGGASATHITLAEGNASIHSAGAADTINAGSGDLTLWTDGNTQVTMGSGAVSVWGDGGKATVNGGSSAASLYLNGHGGGVTFIGGSGDASIENVLSGNTLEAGTGHMSVDNFGGRTTVTGGAGGLDFIDHSGAQVITTAAGAKDTLVLAGADGVYSFGTDSISGGTGNSYFEVHGNSTVSGSTGNSRYVFSGDDILNAAVGGDNVTVAGGAYLAVNLAASRYLNLTETGGTAAISSTANAGETEQVTVSGGANVNVLGGSIVQHLTVGTGAAAPGAGATIVLGAGDDSVQSGGADTIYAGSGADSIGTGGDGVFIVGGAGDLAVRNNDWTANSGRVTVQGGSGLFTYDQGPGSLTFLGGTGDAVINAAYGAADVTAGSGNVTFSGGGSPIRFVAGSGDDSVSLSSAGGTIVLGAGHASVTEWAWGGPDVYEFIAGRGGGNDVITGFKVGKDSLELGGLGVQSQSVSGGSTFLALTDGTQVELVGVADLPSSEMVSVDGLSVPASTVVTPTLNLPQPPMMAVPSEDVAVISAAGVPKVGMGPTTGGAPTTQAVRPAAVPASTSESAPAATAGGTVPALDPMSFSGDPDMQVSLLYRASLGRLPDAPGLAYWVRQLATGETLQQEAAYFASSPEFMARYGAASNGDFVTLMYQNTLARAPDASGFAWWKSEMDTGAMTRAQVAVGFAESPENLRLHGPAILASGLVRS